MTRDVHPALVWFGVLAAPLAWVAQLVAGYAFQEASCVPFSGGSVLEGDSEPWIGAISIVAILVALAGIAAAAASRTAVRGDGGADPRGRIAFMADIGLLGSLIFLAVIVLGAVALPSLDACDPG